MPACSPQVWPRLAQAAKICGSSRLKSVTNGADGIIPLMPEALLIGHHFSISAFLQCGKAPANFAARAKKFSAQFPR
jgi:hypothetical protein